MKKRKLLAWAWVFGGLSLAGNAVLLWQRNAPDAPVPQKQSRGPGHGESIGPPTTQPEAALISPEGKGRVEMDFSGTAFADGSWKLTEAAPEEAVKLDREFKWEEAGPAPAASRSTEQSPPP